MVKKRKIKTDIGGVLDVGEVMHTVPVDMPESEEEEDKGTSKLIFLIGIVLVSFLVLLFVALYLRNKPPEIPTIDDLHDQNLKGKLDASQGYIYDGYSFVKFMDQWFTQMQKGNTVYDLGFNYDPKHIENISVKGKLSSDFFSSKTLYITFDPVGDDLKYVSQANFGFSRSLVSAFGYDLSAGCISNKTSACKQAGVITCDDLNKSVIYFKEADETQVLLNGTCVIVQGRGADIVKAKDRLLLRWYGLLDKGSVTISRK